MFDNENIFNSAKSISELTKKGNEIQNVLNGLRSKSGWERLKTGAKLISGLMG